MKSLCWNPEGVSLVIKPDADYVPEEVFWAVDYDSPLTIKPDEGQLGKQTTTEKLVDQFLHKSQNHFQLAVIGSAGTGKSHLIHRMRQHIQKKPGFEILEVRRLETNLRTIIEKLVAKLPKNKQKRYRDELDKVGTTLSTPSAQKNTLLDSLCQAIEEDFQRPDSSIDDDFERDLLEELPNLLRDPYLRKAKFLKSGEIIPELIDRLFSSKEGKRLEERVHFEVSNLPLEDINKEDCSNPTRSAIDLYLYGSERSILSTLEVINRNLDSAISRSLNFSGDQLGKLLGEIRTFLKTQDKELIILFEEFARLQGYDSAMLEALLVQGDEVHCNIRWALACTTGRYLEFPDTVRTRMNGVIDMECSPSKLSIKDFAGRYLNAVRVGHEKLKNEFDRATKKDLPNACSTCPKEDTCKDSFGKTSDGYSLFPFTETALNTMSNAVNPNFATKFNPRFIQKGVLIPVLVNEANALQVDQFPTKSLVEGMNLRSLRSSVRERLRRMNENRFDQYSAIIQLYSDGKLKNPPYGVMQEFGLDLLPIDTDPEGEEEEEKEEDENQDEIKKQKIQEKVDKLSEWAKVNGNQLDQTLAQEIRELLFPLIERAIDWDAIGLIPSTFSGSSSTANRPFRNTSISFVRQATTSVVNPPIVHIKLPLQEKETEYDQVANAFETLLKTDSKGDWWKDMDLYDLSALVEIVDSCANEVVKQLTQLRGASKNWDPISAIVELLLIGSALGGVLSAKNLESDKLLIEMIFTSIPDECPLGTPELQDLYNLLFEDRNNLKNLLLDHVSATKGGQVGRFIDPFVPVRATNALLQRNWELQLQPIELPKPYKIVGELYRKVQSKLHSALQKEQSQNLSWLSEVTTNLGSDPNTKSILDAITQTLDAAAKGALPVDREMLEYAKGTFASVKFVDAVVAAQQLEKTDSPQANLPNFALIQQNTVEATQNVIHKWTTFLDSAESEVRVQLDEYKNEEVERETQSLKSDVSKLIDILSKIDDRDESN